MKDDKLANLFKAMDLLCRKNGCSIKEASEKLNIDRRTFYRILKTCDALNIPYDKKDDVDGPTNSQRYFIDEKYFSDNSSKLLRLSQTEYFMLKYLLSKDTLLQNSGMMPVLDSMRNKLNVLTFCDTRGSERSIYVMDKHRRNYDQMQTDIFAAIMKAVTDHVQLTVTYTSAPDINNKRETKTFELCPYTFVDYNGAFYVIGKNPEYDFVTTYSLDRFSEVKENKNVPSFTVPEDFSPSRLFKDSFGLYNSDETIRLKLLFKWNTWTAITNRNWGRDQLLSKNKDGSFTLEFTSIPGYELESWIRSFGSDVKVIEPAELKEKIMSDFKEALAQY